jgi:hypothetical protein
VPIAYNVSSDELQVTSKAGDQRFSILRRRFDRAIIVCRGRPIVRHFQGKFGQESPDIRMILVVNEHQSQSPWMALAKGINKAACGRLTVDPQPTSPVQRVVSAEPPRDGEMAWAGIL